jgi:hypothetical protein
MYLLCFFLIAYVVDCATYPLYTLSQTDKDNFVKYHNQVRAAWGVTEKVTWSETLATNAGKWASNCKWEHSSAAFRKYGTDEFGNDLVWGENMAKMGTQDASATFPFVPFVTHVEGWKGEEKDWDCTKEEYYYFADGKSEDGCRKTPNPDGSLPMCGHFTQVVWKTTKEIGCAVVKCPLDTAWVGYITQFCVCQYNPGGNDAGFHPLTGTAVLAPDMSKYSSSYANCPGGKAYYTTPAVQALKAEDSGVATQTSAHSASDGITIPMGGFIAVAVVCALVVFLVILVVIAFIVVMKKSGTNDTKSVSLL